MLVPLSKGLPVSIGSGETTSLDPVLASLVDSACQLFSFFPLALSGLCLLLLAFCLDFPAAVDPAEEAWEEVFSSCLVSEALEMGVVRELWE